MIQKVVPELRKIAPAAAANCARNRGANFRPRRLQQCSFSTAEKRTLEFRKMQLSIFLCINWASRFNLAQKHVVRRLCRAGDAVQGPEEHHGEGLMVWLGGCGGGIGGVLGGICQDDWWFSF